MIPFVVVFEKTELLSKVVFAESEEDCRVQAGRLSTTLATSSNSKEFNLDDQVIKTSFYLLNDEE